jgi:hypothetical protein
MTVMTDSEILKDLCERVLRLEQTLYTSPQAPISQEPVKDVYKFVECDECSGSGHHSRFECSTCSGYGGRYEEIEELLYTSP